MTFDEAVRRCMVRGYVARESLPGIKLWKNHEIPIAERVPTDLQDGNDWDHFDPEGEETSIVG
jgi:hypothetical protein